MTALAAAGPGRRILAGVDAEIGAYYARGLEAGRLARGLNRVELARTQEVIGRRLEGLGRLGAPKKVVLDVGGGSGVYACWLSRAGHEVHLIDPVALHLEQAREAAARQPEAPLASVSAGDARRLEWADGSADAVLLLGPLYHLTEREDRVLALREARRVLRPGGLVFAVGISRFASLLDGLRREMLEDAAFREIVARDVGEGQHRNPTGQPGYFTTAFFHHPEELRAEVQEAGFAVEELVALEGVAGVMPDAAVNAWMDDAERREWLLQALRAVEHEPSLVGMSAHIMAIGRVAEA